MSITLSALQKQRTDTAANWTSANPTLLAGELGFESDTGKVKLGTGSTAWTSLGYLGVIPSSGTYPLSQLIMPLGTAGAPPLTFVGDLNTGIYSPGADQVAISTNSSQRLLIDANGNAGLGTASPTTISNYRTLDIRGTTGAFAYIGSSSNFGRLGWNNDLSGFEINCAVNSPLIFLTNGTERARLTSTGLGVGTSSPDGRITVQRPTSNQGISGGLSFKGQDGTTQGGIGTDGVSTNNLQILAAQGIYFHTGNTDGTTNIRATLDSSGRLGIGDSGPDSTLTIKAAASTTPLRISGPSSEFARIDSSGNFGIASSGNLSKLTVNSGNNLSSTALVAFNTQNANINGLTISNWTGSATTQGPRIAFDNSGNSNWYIGGANGNAGFDICQSWGTPLVRIDSSGRVGIGASPSTKLHVYEGSSNLEIRATTNTGGDVRFGFDVNGSTYNWIEAKRSGGALAFAVGDTERFRCDSSGRLLVGTSTSPGNGEGQYAKFVVQANTGGAANGGYISLQKGSPATDGFAAGNTMGLINFGDSAGYTFAKIECQNDATTGANDYPGRLVFSTTADGASSPTERMRILSNGHMLLNTTSDLAHLTVVDSTYGASDIFIRTYGLSGNSFIVRGDGDCENTNNAYGAFSDIKLKENIVVASSQWNDIKALQVRNYNLKSNPSFAQIGLVAQEVETVSPGLVSELPDRDEDGNDLGTVTKSVKYSVLYMKAVKALQEAMERIEALEADVAQLKGA